MATTGENRAGRALARTWMAFGPFLGLIAVALFFAWQTRQREITVRVTDPSTGAITRVVKPPALVPSLRNSSFLAPGNLRTILIQAVIVGIAALGMTLVMIAGGIDLSIGSAVALVTVVVAVLATGFDLDPKSISFGLIRSGSIHVPAVPVAVAMALGVLAGGLCGLVNGKLITSLGLVPFIITLGTLKVFRGLAKAFSGSTQVYVTSEAKPDWLEQILTTNAPGPRG